MEDLCRIGAFVWMSIFSGKGEGKLMNGFWIRTFDAEDLAEQGASRARAQVLSNGSMVMADFSRGQGSR